MTPQERIAQLERLLEGNQKQQIEALAKALEDYRIKRALQDWVINYPQSGTFSSGIGTNKFDFAKATVLKYDGTTDTLPAKLPVGPNTALQSLYLWADTDVTITLRLAGVKTGLINYDQCLSWDGVHVPFDYFEVKHDLPTSFEFVASTSLETWFIDRISTHQMRFSSGTVTTTQKAIQWQAEDIAGSRSNSGSAFTSSTLHMPNIVRKTFIVFNTDPTNSLNVNVQGKGSASSNNWADDASSGASTAVAAGANSIFDVSVRYHFMRVRLTAAANTANFEVHYIGAVP